MANELKSRNQERKELYQKLDRIMHNNGDWNMNYTAIAEEWQIPIRTIHNWRNKILAEMDMIDPRKYGNNIINALESALKQCQLKSNLTKNETLKIKYYQVMTSLSKELTDTLEKFGRKKKVAEQIEVKGKVAYTFAQAMEDMESEESEE